MPNLQLNRLADLNLVYKIIEIMGDNSFTSGQYQVMDGYPNELDLAQIHTWPTITVEIEGVFGRDIELGSKQWPGCQVAIDVFARTDPQRDDLSYLIWNTLNESVYILYDFNTGFPSTSSGVDYSGVTAIGDWGIENLSIINLAPPANTVVEGEKHHCLIDGLILLPNI